MADTTFVGSVTPILADWLNSINDAVYHGTSGITGGVDRTITAKVADFLSIADFATDSDLITNAAGKPLLVPSGKTLTLNVPSQFATIDLALAAIRNWKICRGALVTIQVADGVYALTSSINLNHPDGPRIQLIGNTGSPAACELNWGTSGSGVHGLVIQNNSFSYVNGFKITRAAHGNTTISTGIQADYSNLFIGPNVIVSNWYSGITARYGSYLNANGVTIQGAGDVGVRADYGSTVDVNNATISGTSDTTVPAGFGVSARYGSHLNCVGANITTSKVAGIAAVFGSSVNATNAVTSSNVGSGFFCRNDSSIEATGATASSNGRYGIEEVGDARVFYTSITMSSNTLGNYAEAVYLDNAGGNATVGNRSSTANLYLKTAGTGAVMFETSGGVQGSFYHTANAVNHPALSGAAAGSAPSIAAVGTDANIDLKLFPKGTGNISFGTWTSHADAAIIGYVTIKDAAGTVRRLATIT